MISATRLLTIVLWIGIASALCFSLIRVNERTGEFYKLDAMYDCMMAGVIVINERVFYCSAYTPGPGIPQEDPPSPPRKEQGA